MPRGAPAPGLVAGWDGRRCGTACLFWWRPLRLYIQRAALARGAEEPRAAGRGGSGSRMTARQKDTEQDKPSRLGKAPRLLSLVVPLFNEGGNIEPFFARVVPVLEGIGLDWEVVCVNDGSRDDTLERLIAQRKLYHGIRIL